MIIEFALSSHSTVAANNSYLQGILPNKLVDNFSTSPSTCPTRPLVTANAPPMFCPFQLRSVPDEQN